MKKRDSKETIKDIINNAVNLAESNIQQKNREYLESKGDGYLKKLIDIKNRIYNEEELWELYEECYRNEYGEVAAFDIDYDMNGNEKMVLIEPNKEGKQNFEEWISEHEDFKGITLEDMAIIDLAIGMNKDLSDTIKIVNDGRKLVIENEEINQALKDCKEQIAEKMKITSDKIDLSEKDFKEIFWNGYNQNKSIKDILLGISSLKIEFGVIQDSGMTKEEFNRIMSDIKKLKEAIDENKKMSSYSSERNEFLKAIKSVYAKAIEEYAKSAPEAEMDEAFFQKLYEIKYQGEFLRGEIKARYNKYCEGKTKETEKKSSNAIPTNVQESDSKEGMENSSVEVPEVEQKDVVEEEMDEAFFEILYGMNYQGGFSSDEIQARYDEYCTNKENEEKSSTAAPKDIIENSEENKGEKDSSKKQQERPDAQEAGEIKNDELHEERSKDWEEISPTHTKNTIVGDNSDRKKIEPIAEQNDIIEEKDQEIEELKREITELKEKNQRQLIVVEALNERTKLLEKVIDRQKIEMDSVMNALNDIKESIGNIVKNVIENLKPKGLLGRIISRFTRSQNNEIGLQMEEMKRINGSIPDKSPNDIVNNYEVGTTKEYVKNYIKERKEDQSRRLEINYGDKDQASVK